MMIMYDERVRGLPPRVWRRRRHAARCFTAALPTWRRPTRTERLCSARHAASAAAAVPGVHLERCGAPSSHCSRMRPRRRRHCCRMHVASRRCAKHLKMSTQILQRRLHTIWAARRYG